MSDGAVTDWDELDDAQLGARLAALGPEVEPTGVDLAERVRSAIDSTTPARARGRRWTPLAVAAALILLVGIVVLSIAPARTAVADWLGIGSTAVVVVDELPPADPARPPTAVPPDEDLDPASIRAAAAEQLDLMVLLPAPGLVGSPVGWEIRASGEGQELVVAWQRVTLTARTASAATPLRKMVTAADTVSTTELGDGTPALWIEGFHLRAAGDLVESVGNTLLWEADGVEYRILGTVAESEAVEIAASLR